jgi:hypothetical protein
MRKINPTLMENKDSLRVKIEKEIDFMCDHWVEGDDKSPYSFGGWRGEVLDAILAAFTREVEEMEKGLSDTFDKHFLGTDDIEQTKEEIKNGTYEVYAYAAKKFYLTLLDQLKTKLK